MCIKEGGTLEGAETSCPWKTFHPPNCVELARKIILKVRKFWQGSSLWMCFLHLFLFSWVPEDLPIQFNLSLRHRAVKLDFEIEECSLFGMLQFLLSTSIMTKLLKISVNFNLKEKLYLPCYTQKMQWNVWNMILRMLMAIGKTFHCFAKKKRIKPNVQWYALYTLSRKNMNLTYYIRTVLSLK